MTTMLCFQQVLLCCLLVIMLFGQCHSYHLSTCRQWVAPRHTSNQSPSSAIVSSSPIPLMHSQRHSLRIHVLPTENQEAELFEMDPADAEHLAFLLANVSDAIEKSPELALSLASKNMGFLFSRNIPKLTNQLLGQYPVLKEDQGMMKAYAFLLDFMETVGKELSSIMKENQNILKGLLETTKLGQEEKLNTYISDNAEKLTSPGFLVYLDTEIQNQDANSPMENLLVTLKLRVLDECGKKMGVDVMILPQLAAESDPVRLKEKTIAHVDKYDNEGKQLFLQTLRIMQIEMKKRYKDVDPTLAANLKEVEKIVVNYLGGNKAT